MGALHVVLDTNVLVAGLRSKNGASFQLLSRIGPESGFEIHLSVPLVLEYEAVLLARRLTRSWITSALWVIIGRSSSSGGPNSETPRMRWSLKLLWKRVVISSSRTTSKTSGALSDSGSGRFCRETSFGG